MALIRAMCRIQRTSKAHTQPTENELMQLLPGAFSTAKDTSELVADPVSDKLLLYKIHKNV